MANSARWMAHRPQSSPAARTAPRAGARSCRPPLPADPAVIGKSEPQAASLLDRVLDQLADARVCKVDRVELGVQRRARRELIPAADTAVAHAVSFDDLALLRSEAGRRDPPFPGRRGIAIPSVVRQDMQQRRVARLEALNVELVRPAVLAVGPGGVPAAGVVGVRRTQGLNAGA